VTVIVTGDGCTVTAAGQVETVVVNVRVVAAWPEVVLADVAEAEDACEAAVVLILALLLLTGA